MQELDEKNTKVFFVFLFCGVVGALALIGLAIIQLLRILTFQIGLPHFSNLSKLELLFVCVFLLVTFSGHLVSKFTESTSEDDNPPSESYLNTQKKLRVFAGVVFFIIFISK